MKPENQYETGNDELQEYTESIPTGGSLMKIINLNENTRKELLLQLQKRSPSSYGGYEQTVNLAIECGFSSQTILTADGWKQVKIKK